MFALFNVNQVIIIINFLISYVRKLDFISV